MNTIVAALLAVVIVLLIILIIKQFTTKNSDGQQLLEQMRRETDALDQEIAKTRQEIIQFSQNNLKNMGDILSQNQREAAAFQDKRLAELYRLVNDMSMQNEQKLENIRKSMENSLKNIQQDNGRQLEKMRETVDEKLQKTLEDRIGQSFKLVSERLEQVYRGLGEMQTLASGVGDLKKVLSNVKTRGTLGELQLGAILEQILPAEQYDENVVTRPGHTERVEFAVRLPGDDDSIVYLPIDAKFPADKYANLMDASDSGDSGAINLAGRDLEISIRKSAKDIHDKYIEPPATTDFAIMFLPVEGLYAEVVRRGFVEKLQRDYKINIAGPTTMAALLNSLQMGFKTLAIQKHSGEVWNVLGAVKTEFDKFENVLKATQNRINQANVELDRLVGTRTRSIQRKLRDVTCIAEGDAQELLETEAEEKLTDYGDVE